MPSSREVTNHWKPVHRRYHSQEGNQQIWVKKGKVNAGDRNQLLGTLRTQAVGNKPTGLRGCKNRLTDIAATRNKDRGRNPITKH